MRISDWSSDVCSSDLRGVVRSAAGDHGHPPRSRLDAGVDDLIMFFKAERRALAGRPARHQRTGALFDLPVHKAREGGRIERPVAEWRHQGGNRTRKPVSLLRSEEHTPELQSLMRLSYAVFCLHKKKK